MPMPGTMPMSGTVPGAGGSEGTDHGASEHGASQHPDSHFDAHFIDSMIEHHEGAIAMAELVLEQSDREELRALAEEIIAAQEAEIAQLKEWRAEWYPDLPTAPGMGVHMGDMALPDDESVEFDARFLQAMISHHRGAIEMARIALEQSERPE